jgi:helix-turn-helix protein
VTNPARSTIRTRTAPTSGARERLQQARAVSAGSPLVDAQDAAKLLGVPSTWLLAQARAQRIPHQKLGHYVRFDIDRLIAWLEENETQPRPPTR